jgi:uncharacterized protein YfaS (alpha-2-macroglobulin family)
MLIMRKFLFIPLAIIFIVVLIAGKMLSGAHMYSQDELNRFNETALEKAESSKSFVDLEEADSKEPMAEEGMPVISVAYPSSLEDGGSVESDRVFLKFSGESDIVKATLNGMSISTSQATITTRGTYRVVIEDEEGNEAEFGFTLVK